MRRLVAIGQGKLVQVGKRPANDPAAGTGSCTRAVSTTPEASPSQPRPRLPHSVIPESSSLPPGPAVPRRSTARPNPACRVRCVAQALRLTGMSATVANHAGWVPARFDGLIAASWASAGAGGWGRVPFGEPARVSAASPGSRAPSTVVPTTTSRTAEPGGPEVVGIGHPLHGGPEVSFHSVRNILIYLNFLLSPAAGPAESMRQ